MEKTIFRYIRSFILFGRNFAGCINAPYITYRKLAGGNADLRQTVFIPILIIFYFVFVTTLRNGIRNPFLLTMKFNALFISSLTGFLLILTLFYFVGRLVGGKGNIRQIYLLWAFSLLPTLIWFFATSLLYLILPPPRTISFWGKLYSMVYVVFSLSVLFWKAILYYLTLRFSLKLDLWRILQASSIIVPILTIYALLMYNLGIFRIPFI